MTKIERRISDIQYGRWNSGGRGRPISAYYRIRLHAQGGPFDLWSYAYEGDLEKLYKKLQGLKGAWVEIGYLESGDILYLSVYGESLLDPEYAAHGILYRAQASNRGTRDAAIFFMLLNLPFLAVIQVETKSGKRFPD